MTDIRARHIGVCPSCGARRKVRYGRERVKCLKCSAPPTQLRHGHYGTPTYGSWAAMKGRCCNITDSSYDSYGALGIKICARWLNDFANFIKDMGERPKGKTLDRINPFGHYEPVNCRWATPKEQQTNLRIHFARIKSIEMLVRTSGWPPFRLQTGDSKP